MRRLLVSVACSAVAAVALLVPSTAFATPTITGAPVATASPTITINWTDDAIALNYAVHRATGTCAANPGTLPAVSGTLAPGSTSYADTVALEGPYCYYVEGDYPLEIDSPRVTIIYDVTAPTAVAVTHTGGDGCSPFTITGASASDISPVTFTADGNPLPYTPPPAAPYALIAPDPSIVAIDAASNQTTVALTGQRFEDATGPGPVALEVSTDPAAQKATLNWDILALDGAPVTYRVRTRGPQGPKMDDNLTPPFVPQQSLQVDATYEFTLEAVDACGRLTSSVRLVRLNDASPPTMPVVASVVFGAVSHAVNLSWVASRDNIQVDHYVVLRNGVPLGATDATSFTDAAPPQHAQLSYVVRAVDTNGNSTDSAAALITTPDWTPPNAPTLTVTVQGATATLRWTAATDNVGVVGYDVVRNGKGRARVTSAVRTFRDTGLTPGLHTWTVSSRDDAELTAASAPETRKVSKVVATARVLSLRMKGTRAGALRYSLKPRARLLVDLRVVGTVAKAKLRFYVNSGRGRITVWRGTPGSSAPRLRLGSARARRGYVTVRLSRTLHTGRIRLVLIPGGHVVIAGKGAHRPVVRTK